jgi:Mce-associated membrane protein
MKMRDPLRDGLFVLAALAVAAAAWFGYTWWSSAHDEASLRAADRDEIMTAANQGLVALNTIDYRSAQHDVDKWVQVTTGQLGKDLGNDRETQQQRASASKTIATAAMKQSAVTELDHGAGSARVIAVLDLQVSTNGSPAAANRSRLNVELTRTDQGWKVSSVQSAAAS